MEDSKKFNLIWERIGTPKEVLENVENLELHQKGYKGVYLWTENIDGETIANYIGKHQKCILSRTIEHLYYHLTLKNSLPSLYRENRKRLIIDWTKNTKKIKENCEYIPIYKYLNNKLLTELTMKEVSRYFEKITIYFCNLNDLTNKEIDAIESFLIFNLQPLENNKKTGSFNNSSNMTAFSRSADGLLDFEKLIKNTKNYLKDNKLDPRPNINSLAKST